MAADLLARVRAEIDTRLVELRPAMAEYERLLGAAGALDEEARAVGARARAADEVGSAEKARAAKPRPAAKARRATKPRAAAKARRAAKPRQARMGAGEQAIVAALEHGSHTVSELGVVTAMSGAEIRESARRLLRAGKIVRAKREGRAAYALADSA
jgi:hypothetical protein